MKLKMLLKIPFLNKIKLCMQSCLLSYSFNACKYAAFKINNCTAQFMLISFFNPSICHINVNYAV